MKHRSRTTAYSLNGRSRQGTSASLSPRQKVMACVQKETGLREPWSCSLVLLRGYLHGVEDGHVGTVFFDVRLVAQLVHQPLPKLKQSTKER